MAPCFQAYAFGGILRPARHKADCVSAPVSPREGVAHEQRGCCCGQDEHRCRALSPIRTSRYSSARSHAYVRKPRTLSELDDRNECRQLHQHHCQSATRLHFSMLPALNVPARTSWELDRAHKAVMGKASPGSLDKIPEVKIGPPSWYTCCTLHTPHASTACHEQHIGHRHSEAAYVCQL